MTLLKLILVRGLSPAKIFKSLKGPVSRSGPYKTVKRLKETSSRMLMVRSVIERSVRTKKTHWKNERKGEKSQKTCCRAHVNRSTFQRTLNGDLSFRYRLFNSLRTV